MSRSERRPAPTEEANNKTQGEKKEEVGDRYHPGEVPADLEAPSDDQPRK